MRRASGPAAAVAALAALLLLPAAGEAATCGQINRVLDTPTHIVDAPTASVTSRIWIPHAGAIPPQLQDVDINVDITHPIDDDLDISISHLGRTVSLSTDNGGGGQNYTRTVFDDEAAGLVTAGSAPFTGSFKPEQALDAFDDMEPGGVWTLTVRDDTGAFSNPGGGGPPPPQEINSWGIRWEANSCGAVRPPCDEVVHRVGVPVSDPGSGSSSESVSGTGSVTRVEPRLTLTHPRDSDLHMTLTHGSTTVDLADNRGGSGANYTRTLFSDSAAIAISAGAAPFTGSFRPENPLSAFNGAAPSGNWQLTVGDEVGGMAGTWDEWSLRIVLTTCTDPDDDAVWTAVDNCPNAANPGQENHDRFKDTLGDACDDDDDQDGHPDTADACPLSPTGPGDPTDPDTDADGCFDPEDADDDNDGVVDTSDGCVLQPVGTDGDPDGDGCGNAVDTDDDDDGVGDATDNCASLSNGSQADLDGDLQGDACDVDDDGDGLVDSVDACHVLAARTLSGCPAFARKISFKFTGRRKLRGTLTISGTATPAPACLAGQSVRLFRVKRGTDPVVGKPLTTSPTGTFALTRRLARGRYYVTTTGVTVPDVAECGAAKSKAVKSAKRV